MASSCPRILSSGLVFLWTIVSVAGFGKSETTLYGLLSSEVIKLGPSLLLCLDDACVISPRSPSCLRFFMVRLVVQVGQVGRSDR